MGKDKLKYYKGERTNPFEEITATQGAHCQRYNTIASVLWNFEYHWANGWEEFCKLEVRPYSLYFEQHPQPQKDFADIMEALQAFVYGSYFQYPLNNDSSSSWIAYIYSEATKERFYKPLFDVVKAEDVPKYLHWYKGENVNPYAHNPQEQEKRFWWGFEQYWLVSTEHPTKESWEEYLHTWLVRSVDLPWDAIPAATRNKYLTAYKAGIKIED